VLFIQHSRFPHFKTRNISCIHIVDFKVELSIDRVTPCNFQDESLAELYNRDTRRDIEDAASDQYLHIKRLQRPQHS